MKIRQSKTVENIITKGIMLYTGDSMNHPLDNVFKVMLDEDNCLATLVMQRLLKDWEFYQLRVRLNRQSEQFTQANTFDRVKIFAELHDSLQRLSIEYSVNPKQPEINTVHLLLHIIDNPQTLSSRLLALYNITTSTVAKMLPSLPLAEDGGNNELQTGPNTFRIESHFGSTDRNVERRELVQSDETTDRQQQKLEQFGIDLTKAARQGKIDPVVGRDAQTERVIQILGRRKKNNPVLIGEAGVGKSAIVEGLALRIVENRVPENLAGKRVFSLDVTSMVAGTKYRGEFEERIKELLELLENDSNLILFIDEIHTIVGAGATQGSLDTANILKPALARGLLQCIGATTLDEYRQSIEQDAALERRFQKVVVEPTNAQQTLEILLNLRANYEQHHSVVYTQAALEACVELSDRYITDRNFPDKAIDLMDEVGSRAHIGAVSKMPVSIDADYVREVTSRITGIPVSRITEQTRARLSEIFDRLTQSVVGQQHAIERLSAAIVRSSAGLKEESRPIGVFMFVGPSGVGKTLLAKELAKAMFYSPDALIRFDMSEYSQAHNISRLIGSPPGYVGYNQGGQLTESVRRRPYSVVLFDEIEKAHPDLFNLMLQIMDDGRLTDSLGRTVDFSNTIIILSSNAS